MKKSTINLTLGSVLAAGGTLLILTACKDMQKKAIEDADLKSEKSDQLESVDADKVSEEKGLTQLDSAHRAEWIANGFPQTHKELKELEEQEEKETH